MNKHFHIFALSIGLLTSSNFYAHKNTQSVAAKAKQFIHSGALKKIFSGAVAVANTYQTGEELKELKDGFSSTKYLAGLLISISGTWEAYEKFYKTALREKKEKSVSQKNSAPAAAA